MNSTSRLSDLQKRILVRAYLNRVNENLDERRKETNHNGNPDLFIHEVLWHEYDFGEYDKYEGEYLRGLGWRMFNKQAIGDKRYRAAQAAVSRARKSLYKRGLIALTQEGRLWGKSFTVKGIVLTNAGIELAKRLMPEYVVETVNTE